MPHHDERPVWRKARTSEAHGACVMIAQLDNQIIGVRDSKNPDGPILACTAGEWRRLTEQIRSGALDR